MKRYLNLFKCGSGFVLACSILSVVGCGKLPAIFVEPKEQKFESQVQIDDKVDVLFVVDNSLSMDLHQENLTKAFDSFINVFAKKGLDFHVGIISTEVSGSSEYWTKNGTDSFPMYNLAGIEKFRDNPSVWGDFANVGPGSLLVYGNGFKFDIQNGTKSQLHYLDQSLLPANRDTSNLVKQFMLNAKLGASSYSGEAGLLSTIAALAPEFITSWYLPWVNETFKAMPDRIQYFKKLNPALLLNSAATTKWNEGFLRPDSRLIVIILSSDDESFPIFARHDAYDRQSPFIRKLLSDKTPAEKEISEKFQADYVANVVKILKGLREERPERLTFAAVIDTDEKDELKKNHTDPVTGNVIVHSNWGKIYQAVAKELNGSVIDINDPGVFAAKLGDISRNVVSALNEWTVRQLVQDDQDLLVCVDEEINDIDECTISANPTDKDPAKRAIMKGRMLTRGTEFQIRPHPTDKTKALLRVIGTGITQKPGAKYRMIYVPRAPIG